jgi:predicted nucleic acid-binding protein
VKYLLDVNMLLAALWVNHPKHGMAFGWLAGKNILVCPLCELGFLRISTNRKAFGAPMAEARALLGKFIQERGAKRVPDDLAPLESFPVSSEETTDIYLADLAAKNGARLATLDGGVKHPAAELVG